MRKVKIKFVDFSDEGLIKELRKILSKHYELVECDNPDYLFYSVFGYEHLKYDCIRIFITGENFSPDFNVCDYAMGFDHISFEDRYLRVPLYLFYDYAVGVSERVSLTEDDIRSKCKFCNFVYSNSKNASPIREEFFHKLSEYKTVDSGGRFLNNIGGPVEDKDEFQKQYKFSIAFENSSTSGYTTEKLFEALKNGTIPIYWGNPNADKDFNPRSFINVHDYGSLDEVIEKVKQIDNDDSLFTEYLKQPMSIRPELDTEPLKECEEFLVHIIEQDYDKAFRRKDSYFSKNYLRQMRFYFLKQQKLSDVMKKLRS